VSISKETTTGHNKPIKTLQQFGEELMFHKSAKELLSNRLDVAMQDRTQLLLSQSQRKQPEVTTNQSKLNSNSVKN